MSSMMRRRGTHLETALYPSMNHAECNYYSSYLGISLIEAGADTTAMALQFFVLCMLAHPDVLAKAQREVDDVIGPDRSPQLDDLKDLSYVRSIINEVRLVAWCPTIMY